MFTVSCYAFHPLALKFLRIWRYTQVVSEVLTCILSMLCCQCMNMMLLSNSSSLGSTFSVQIFKDEIKNNAICDVIKEGGDQNSQHTVIEMNSEPGELPEVQKQLREGQHTKTNPVVQDIVERPVHKQICSRRDLQITTSFWTHKLADSKNLPAIHSTRKINRKGILMPTSNLYINDLVQVFSVDDIKTNT